MARDFWPVVFFMNQFRIWFRIAEIFAFESSGQKYSRQRAVQTLGSKQWAVNSGHGTVGSGQWAVDSGQWTVDS